MLDKKKNYIYKMENLTLSNNIKPPIKRKAKGKQSAKKKTKKKLFAAQPPPSDDDTTDSWEPFDDKDKDKDWDPNDSDSVDDSNLDDGY